MRLLPLAQGYALLIMSITTTALAEQVLAGDQNTVFEPVVYATAAVRPDARVASDSAKLQARARIVYVSSGPIAFSVRMIDNDLRTVFRFSGRDLHPTIIVELAEHELLHRVSAVFDPEEKVKLDVYLINELPKNLGNLDGAQPLTCSIDQTPPVEAAADFAPANARYVVYRWTRDKATKSPFRVAEVSALSSVSPEQIPPAFAENEMHFPGETAIDFSNKLGTLADPPTIAVVSP
jgi:hypothetical protein